MPKQIGLIAVIEAGAAQMSRKFLTAKGQIDRVKVRAAVRERFAGKAAFINRYQGMPRRFWLYSIARRIIRETNSAARMEFHLETVCPIAETRITYTRGERAVIARSDATMARAPIDGWGNRRFKEAARDSRAVRELAYQRTLEIVRREFAA